MIGFLGAGNMARALARGWGEPVLCSDGGSGRAQALVDELGGEALRSADVAARADVLVLAHKPAQLRAVADEAAPQARGKVVSVLGSNPLEELRAAYPSAQSVVRAMPNTPVEVREGVVVVAQESDDVDAARALFAPLGRVLALPEAQLTVATATMGVVPAYLALVAEAHVDAAVRHGLPAGVASELTLASMAGTARLAAARDGDTLAVRREVASPGGSTARGLAALERGGVRAAFADAMRAVVDPR